MHSYNGEPGKYRSISARPFKKDSLQSIFYSLDESDVPDQTWLSLGACTKIGCSDAEATCQVVYTPESKPVEFSGSQPPMALIQVSPFLV